MANNTEKGISNTNKVAMGAGLAMLAAGAYFFLGPDGKKHQKKLKGWTVKMKGEVLEKLEAMEEVTQPMYDEVVDTVAKAQAVATKIPKSEIMDLAAELKKHWRSISRLAKGDVKKVKMVTKKTVRSSKAPSKSKK
jgi:hypothetical protein